MTNLKDDEPAREGDAPPSHQEMVRRLKADPLCTYVECEDDDDNSMGVEFIGGINPNWGKKHMKASRRKR
jgi:hypothetical protein